MTSPIGAHVQAWTPGAVDWAVAVKSRILKIMDPAVEPLQAVIAAAKPGALVIRSYIDLPGQDVFIAERRVGGIAVADRVAAQFDGAIAVAKAAGIPVYAEGLNETGIWEQATNYNEFTIGFAARCARHGLLPLAYSFATGNPPGYRDGSPDDLRAYWAHYLEGLRACLAAGGGLAIHEYDAPTMRRLGGWLCLRYRKVIDILPGDLQAIPIAITEAGIDAGVLRGYDDAPNQAGWRALHVSEADYASDLVWYAWEIDRDPQVLGATLFTVGGYWPSFDATDSAVIRDALAGFVSHRPPTGAGAWPNSPATKGRTPMKPTSIDVSGAMAFAGGSASFRLDYTGVDAPPGFKAVAVVAVAYPPRPDDPQWRLGGNTQKSVELPAGDGSISVSIPLTAADSRYEIVDGMIGEITIAVYEAAGSFQPGGPAAANEHYQQGVFGPFPLPFLRSVSDAAGLTTPPPPVPGPAVPPPAVDGRPRAIAPVDDLIFRAAGDIINAAREVGDVTLESTGVMIHQYIDWLKGVGSVNPFMGPRR